MLTKVLKKPAGEVKIWKKTGKKKTSEKKVKRNGKKRNGSLLKHILKYYSYFVKSRNRQCQSFEDVTLLIAVGHI